MSILAIINNPTFWDSVLPSLIASGFIEAIKVPIEVKKAASQRIANESPQERTIRALYVTLKRFYESMEYEYQEEIIFQVFLEQQKKFTGNNMKWCFRNIIEHTCGQTLTDGQYKNFVTIFNEECRNYQFADKDLLKDSFEDRESALRRIIEKYENFCEDCKNDDYGDYRGIITNAIDSFNYSWKEQLIEEFEKLCYSYQYGFQAQTALEFVKTNEDCDAIRKTFFELYRYVDWDHSDEGYYNRRELEQALNHLRYNKVWMITGTSGSGKTHLIRNYSKIASEQLKREDRIINENNTTIPCFIDISHLLDDDVIIVAIKNLFEIECPSIDDYCGMLDAMRIKLCFVLENISCIISTSDEWQKYEQVIQFYCKYDQFCFAITINEYDYYLLSSAVQFQDRYCIPVDQRSVFHNCLSIDEENCSQNIIQAILKQGFNINVPYDNYQTSITTPKEAFYYGECIKDESESTLPQTYYDYFYYITKWKDDALAGRINKTSIEYIISKVTNLRSCTFDIIMGNPVKATEIKELQNLQLISFRERIPGSLFSLDQDQNTYDLRFYPYWAVKIIGFLGGSLSLVTLLYYPDEIKEWLISSYIFSNSENNYWNIQEKDDQNQFFEGLRENGLLSYALFCAHKSSVDFIKALYRYLVSSNHKVDNPKLCFAFLRFILQCPLKISEKFKLCMKISEVIVKFDLLDLYERTISQVLESTTKLKNLKSNMMIFASCKEKKINHINGYQVGRQYMKLASKQPYEKIVGDIVSYLENNRRLLTTVQSGNNECFNESFLDFFLRRCFEIIVSNTGDNLQTIYETLSQITHKKEPIGPYVKRNLTCAAGNLFEHRIEGSNYVEENSFYHDYINTAKHYAQASNLFDKMTAYFLVSNSIGEEFSKVDPELRNILELLARDMRIKNKVGKEIDAILNQM